MSIEILGLVVLYLVFIFLPWKKWFIAIDLTLGAGIVFVWAEHIYQSYQPDYDAGPGTGLGIAIFAFITGLYILAIFLKFLIYIVKSRVAASRS